MASFGPKEFAAYGLPFLVAVGACYLFGYWGHFGINVLEFVGFADLAKLALYPLLAGLGLTLCGAIAGDLLTSDVFPPGGAPPTKVTTFVKAHWRWFVAAQTIAIPAVALFGPHPLKWFIVTLLVATLAVPVASSRLLIAWLPEPRVRALCAFTALFLPAVTFAYGRLDAYYTEFHKSGKAVDVARSKLALSADAPVVYLGLLGATYVLRESRTGAIVLVKQKDDSPLFLVAR
jgi:hypothetical protein